MSQYSDLVDEMLTDQMGAVSLAKQIEYDIIDAIERNPQIEKFDEEIKQRRSNNCSLRARSSARAKNNVITKEESKRQQDANEHKISGLETRKKTLSECDGMLSIEKANAVFSFVSTVHGHSNLDAQNLLEALWDLDPSNIRWANYLRLPSSHITIQCCLACRSLMQKESPSADQSQHQSISNSQRQQDYQESTR